MATVTAVTAERTLAIEAASIVDGDVVGDNLILTRHDGGQINAGSVRGPQGVPGPPSSDVAVITAQPVLDVGMAGQIRAGRQLAATDFTDMGLPAPIGLWNLSDLTDVSGNGRNLLNKGAVPFVAGINGLAATAARFIGSTGQTLYIPDTGAADPFRIKTGTFGAWVRTSMKAQPQQIMGKWKTAEQSWCLYINSGGTLEIDYGFVAATPLAGPTGSVILTDDRWHWVVGQFDGTTFRLYVDGFFDGQFQATGVLFPSSAPFNIGAVSGDAGTASATPHFGRIDEAFVTDALLSEEQILNLYCARIPHALGVAPTRITCNVRRRRRGSTLVVGDFPAQPLRLYNFSAGSLGDEGSNGTALTNNNGVLSASGADGLNGNAMYLGGAQSLSSTDAGLPAGTATRSYGCWFKTTNGAAQGLLSWGAGQGDVRIMIESGQGLAAWSGANALVFADVSDGVWHHVVVVEDNLASDTVKFKMYVDGRLVGSQSPANIGSIVLSGANRFRIGTRADATAPLIGHIDGVFISSQALSPDEVYKLYAKGSQALAPSPKNAGDHVEALTTTAVLATFDSLDSTAQVDLGVAA